MNATINFGQVLDGIKMSGVRVTEIDELPVQFRMATEEIGVRTILARRRNDTLGTLVGSDVIMSIAQKLGYGEKVTFQLRSPYGDRGVLTIERHDRHSESFRDDTDGFAWAADRDLRDAIGF